MTRTYLPVLTVLALLFTGSVYLSACGNGDGAADGAAASSSSSSSDGERKVAYWKAPMDPSYIRDKPGKSPMGMDLIPVYADEATGDDSNVVSITPGVVQQIGVVTGPVKRTTVSRKIRTIGQVEVAEDELSTVNLRFSGWVERIYVERTGDEVKKGQVLFDIYSPELVAAEEDYLLAIRSQGMDSELAKSSRRKLELFDISDRDINAVAKAGKARRAMPIRAPFTSYVLSKDIVEGARVMAGHDLYQMGDLRRIWVNADVYEYDAPWVEVGQPAQLELTYQVGPPMEGKVAYVYPTLNPISRTLKVRLEFDNKDMRLKPGMFATVYLQTRTKKNVIAVPSAAILDSGKRELAFVALGKGRFEPREVRTGLVGDNRMTEIVSGLSEGERVVLSSQFLIDSESQLQEAVQKILASSRSDKSEQSEMKMPAGGEK
ncbi:MAG: efflux RND transporter periplasmic adaptor subunit [Oligoflexia bacterium]|nr:efflux RND transporter periplasmic adaptor subunit [Oligoflexia bacterium]